jgi:DNA-binding LacI/PurR family transcriptional regulator
MPRTPQALERTLGFLRDHIARNRAPAGSRLEGVRSLSRRAGASQKTLVRAVGVLKQEGVVRTHPGRGTFVVGPGASAVREPLRVEIATSDAPPVAQKWRLLANAMRSDIVSGRLGHGHAFPSAKELSLRYGANFRTMRKALQSLLREGYLNFASRRYAVAGARCSPEGSRIALVVLVERLRPFGNLPPRSRELLGELGSHCASRGIALDLCFCYYEGDVFRPAPELAALGRQHGKGLLGTIVWTIGLSTDQVGVVLGQLRLLGLPTAVLDEQGELPPLTGRLAATVRVVRMGPGSASGKVVGHYLARLGHRRVAYLAWTPLGAWSQARLAGLNQAFEACGHTDGVRLMDLGPVVDPGLDLSPYFAHHIAPVGLPPGRRKVAIRAIRRLEPDLWHSVEQETRRARLHRRLEQLLTDRKVTAWVASGDQLALNCLEHLTERKVQVPRQLSLVGFDDTPEALYNGLTSYSFNPKAVVRTLVDLVLTSPARLRREGRVEPVEVPGFVSERGSSGAVG